MRAKPNIPAARKKLKVIRYLVVLALVLLAGSYVLSHIGVSTEKMREQVIDNCVDTGPYAPAWKQQLEAYGLADKGDEVIRPYCHCMWDDKLKTMSGKEIRTFFEADADTQVQQLGGQQAISARHEGCLKNLQTQFAGVAASAAK